MIGIEIGIPWIITDMAIIVEDWQVIIPDCEDVTGWGANFILVYVRATD